MNKILFSAITGLILLFSGTKSSAQGLQLNQVLKVGAVEDTVPVGKVWKVEAYWQSRTSISSGVEVSCGLENNHHPFYIDGAYYFKYEGGPGTSSASRFGSPGNTFPLWLPSGTRLRTTCPDDFLSVLEFNE